MGLLYLYNPNLAY